MHHAKVLGILCFISTVVFCQQQDKNIQINSLISHVEEIYETDNRLVNGETYFEKSGLIKGHPYIESDKWTIGTLYIAATSFDSVVLKFNIEIGQLILNYRFRDDQFTKIVLNESLIDSFRIHQKTFVHSRHFDTQKAFAQYYEPIYRNKLVFIKTFKKEHINKYANSAPDGYFSDTDINYYLGVNGRFYKTDRRKALLGVFPENRKSIKKYFRKNKIKLQKANNQELYKLIRYCEKISTH